MLLTKDKRVWGFPYQIDSIYAYYIIHNDFQVPLAFYQNKNIPLVRYVFLNEISATCNKVKAYRAFHAPKHLFLMHFANSLNYPSR
jgi:hypothetical protein